MEMGIAGGRENEEVGEIALRMLADNDIHAFIAS
jgi:hypothetical protein